MIILIFPDRIYFFCKISYFVIIWLLDILSLVSSLLLFFKCMAHVFQTTIILFKYLNIPSYRFSSFTTPIFDLTTIRYLFEDTCYMNYIWEHLKHSFGNLITSSSRTTEGVTFRPFSICGVNFVHCLLVDTSELTFTKKIF